MLHKLLTTNYSLQTKSLEKGSITLILSAAVLIGSLIGSVALSPITNFDVRQQAMDGSFTGIDDGNGNAVNGPVQEFQCPTTCNAGAHYCREGKRYECIKYSDNCSTVNGKNGVWRFHSNDPNCTTNGTPNSGPASTAVPTGQTSTGATAPRVNRNCFVLGKNSNNELVCSRKSISMYSNQTCRQVNSNYYNTQADCDTALARRVTTTGSGSNTNTNPKPQENPVNPRENENRCRAWRDRNDQPVYVDEGYCDYFAGNIQICTDTGFEPKQDSQICLGYASTTPPERIPSQSTSDSQSEQTSPQNTQTVPTNSSNKTSINCYSRSDNCNSSTPTEVDSGRSCESIGLFSTNDMCTTALSFQCYYGVSACSVMNRETGDSEYAACNNCSVGSICCGPQIRIGNTTGSGQEVICTPYTRKCAQITVNNEEVDALEICNQEGTAWVGPTACSTGRSCGGDPTNPICVTNEQTAEAAIASQPYTNSTNQTTSLAPQTTPSCTLPADTHLIPINNSTPTSINHAFICTLNGVEYFQCGLLYPKVGQVCSQDINLSIPINAGLNLIGSFFTDKTEGQSSQETTSPDSEPMCNIPLIGALLCQNNDPSSQPPESNVEILEIIEIESDIQLVNTPDTNSSAQENTINTRENNNSPDLDGKIDILILCDSRCSTEYFDPSNPNYNIEVWTSTAGVTMVNLPYLNENGDVSINSNGNDGNNYNNVITSIQNMEDPPEFVVIMTGANDIQYLNTTNALNVINNNNPVTSGYSLTWVESANNTVDSLEEIGIVPVIVAPTSNTGANANRQLDDVYLAIAEQQQIPIIIPSNNDVTNDNNYDYACGANVINENNLSDGTHINLGDYEPLNELISSCVQIIETSTRD